jgi:hypothetical protein
MIRWVASGAAVSNSRNFSVPVKAIPSLSVPDTWRTTVRPPWTIDAVSPAGPLAVTWYETASPFGVLVTVSGK